MTDRSTVFEGNQIGHESGGAGVTVPADKRLLAMEFTPTPQTESQEFGPRGSKYNTVVLNNKEWTEAGIGGVGAYNDLVYPFSGLFGEVAPTTPDAVNAPNAREWVWNPVSFGPDNGETFTIETGSTIRAERFSNALFNAFNMTFNRGGVSIGGQVLGQLTTDGVTLTATPTDVALEPIAADDINVYLDTSAASLGTTQLERAIEVSWGISDKYGTVWPLNKSKTSFAAHIERKPTAESGVTLGADATGMGLLSVMRTGASRFLRIEALGPTIGGAIAYKLWCDLCVKILNPNDKGDEEGLLTQPYALRIVHDATWGQAMKFTLVTNGITAL